MREERHEHCPGKGQKVKKWGGKTKTVEMEQPLEKQPMEQQVMEEKQPCVEEGCVEQPCFAFDLGADYEAEGGHCGQGDGAVALAWPLGPDCDGEAELARPLSNQTLLEPTPPCQVRTK